MSNLSDTQLDRYARHIVLKEVGGTGQTKLLGARVAVVGAGGLGSACLQYLAAAGVGAIGVIDDDVVDLSNLQRQTIHGTPDVGRPKVESAAQAIARLNPDVQVIQHRARLTADNAATLLAPYDVVADGADTFQTRFDVADACLALRIPLVWAAVGQFEGQLATFKGYEADLPCYRCFVPTPPAGQQRSCAEAGVLGALTGVMGALQALEVIREITGFGPSLAGRLMIYDALSARSRTLNLPKDPHCAACGARP
jgi:molybdopterin-synthase adenylyltransferase